jgi:hypothetical protein
MTNETLEAIIDRKYRELLAVPLGGEGGMSPQQLTQALKGAADWWQAQKGGKPEGVGSALTGGDDE